MPVAGSVRAHRYLTVNIHGACRAPRRRGLARWAAGFALGRAGTCAGSEVLRRRPSVFGTRPAPRACPRWWKIRPCLFVRGRPRHSKVDSSSPLVYLMAKGRPTALPSAPTRNIASHPQRFFGVLDARNEDLFPPVKKGGAASFRRLSSRSPPEHVGKGGNLKCHASAASQQRCCSSASSSP